MIRALSSLIRFYQYALSPVFGGQCRFYPSCSNYALGVLEKHPSSNLISVFSVIRKIFVRLIKCGPWHPGGIDLP